jgi:hypothetical protein
MHTGYGASSCSSSSSRSFFFPLQMHHHLSRIHIGGFRDLTSVDSRISYQ